MQPWSSPRVTDSVCAKYLAGLHAMPTLEEGKVTPTSGALYADGRPVECGRHCVGLLLAQRPT